MKWTNHLFTLALALIAQSALAQDALPDYSTTVLPNWTSNNQELVFETANNINDRTDLYHVDIANRRWTVVNEFGAQTGTWGAELDGHLNPSEPRGIWCLAGPWAVGTCIVGAVVAERICNVGANSAVRRVQQQCALLGMVPEITNTGVCGQYMKSVCRSLSFRRSHQEP